MNIPRLWLAAGMGVLLLTSCSAPEGQPSLISSTRPLPTHQQLTPVPPPEEYLQPLGSSNIDRIWANEGGDKVTQEELRASVSPAEVLNSIWDGKGIDLFGARNEVISFNLILEAPQNMAGAVSVELDSLTGPDGFQLRYGADEGSDLFRYSGQEIDLFYVRYLQIKGISTDLFFAGFNYDERHIPERCRRPLDNGGSGMGNWEDRPCHDLFYPEIAVPLVLETPFDITAGSNQSIWGDIYIPKDAPAGVYQGSIEVQEEGVPTWSIPIQLEVLDFDLPDLPTARTMLYVSRENIKAVYLGDPEIPDLDPGFNEILDRHFQLAHRHKISLIDSYLAPEDADAVWLERLDGSLFTNGQGYAGPGEGTGNNIYSIGTYGDWPWMGEGRKAMWTETDAWVKWLEGQDLSTPTEVFLYLIDESDDYRLVEKWADWMKDNPGPGSQLLSLATMDLPIAEEHVPSLDIPASWAHFGVTSQWQDAAEVYLADPGKRLYLYNSSRPATGSFAIEDEGTALRQLGWAQFKMGVERWFYWEGTYYENFQCYGDEAEASTRIFQRAQTYGCYDGWDASLGETGWNYLNGDGVLFYPGTDTRFPEDNYGVPGPFASLRLKEWRRGIQDADYLALAMDIDPDRTQSLVEEMVPRVLWELGVEDLEDPTYVYADISWPTDPDYWERARRELAEIILTGNE
ncbi:MAG: hypothetical protein AB8I40_02255 [Anaerolineales bacterium]